MKREDYKWVNETFHVLTDRLNRLQVRVNELEKLVGKKSEKAWEEGIPLVWRKDRDTVFSKKCSGE